MTRFRFPTSSCLIIAALSAVAWVSGCKVGPNYVRPQMTAPPAFRGADETAVSSDAKSSLGDEQWSAVYPEPELQELLRKALIKNFDVRIAAQRILEQQAQVRITRSQEFPTVSIGGTAIGASLPSSRHTDSQPPGEWFVQRIGSVDTGFLGLISPPD